MPPRLRPTARLLTPAGWAGLLAAALIVGAAAWALMIALPRA
jgi:hypothetical protein